MDDWYLTDDLNKPMHLPFATAYVLRDCLCCERFAVAVSDEFEFEERNDVDGVAVDVSELAPANEAL